ncbi:MAG: orotidine 5'-phosphate decarboxylase, partial [Candidatus Thermoplasmatota archaeon]|nr:orotidine 5'-phosphate decarboxylase [Candidatus Thermoplasmatota archaeon]
MMLFETEHGVIVACDVSTLTDFCDLVEATCPVEGIVGYKVGAMLGLTYGLPALVREVRERCSLPVIYDHQKAGTDIPPMGANFARVCSQAGIASFIIFPQAGPESERAFIAAVQETGMEPMVGGEMTHPGYLEGEGGFIRDDAPLEMYRIGAEHGVCYFIVPGNRVESLRRYHHLLTGLMDKPCFCMPGIGRQGGSITTAFEALPETPAYAIVGSAIYKSQS